MICSMARRKIVESFAEHDRRANYVVGVVIFMILMIIQFVVINNAPAAWPNGARFNMGHAW